MATMARALTKSPALLGGRRGPPRPFAAGVGPTPCPPRPFFSARATRPFARGRSSATISATMPGPTPQVSTRIQGTDVPCIVDMQRMLRGKEGILSLAQGVTFWPPPQASLDAATKAVAEKAVSSYGADDGLPELREALINKLAEENGLQDMDVMVTSGANQAFVNLVLSLTDAGDRVVFFKPYYFNHIMTLHPDLDWLERELEGTEPPPKMVVIVNPCNPSGVLLTKKELERARDLCAARGTWLVVDNTYEHFAYDGREHHCVSGGHVVNLFSFSKAYGMMGWRVGYIAWPREAGLGPQLLKAQDTIPICPCQISQRVALAAVREGREWVRERVEGLAGNRAAVVDALAPLGAGNIKGGEGAIYIWARLPAGYEDDKAVVEWMVDRHRVCIIPGSACGMPGHVRVAYANLDPETCLEATSRLRKGLEELVEAGGGGALPSS